ncbi:MAG: 50S ribosomal protein L11 methyltransferase [Hyphomonadaceae bacterium]
MTSASRPAALPSVPHAMEVIRAHTRPIMLADLDVALWLADELTPIWEATESDLEARRMGPPFWAFAWAGGQAVARYVLLHPEIVAGKRVLDLAAGSGLLAIAAMKAGAASALANDVDPWCEAAVELNAEENGVRVAWTGVDLLDAALPEVDVILAGDVFYEAEMARRFLAFLKRAHGAGVDVLVGDPARTYFPRDAFVQAAEYAIETTTEIESADTKRTRVWRL